MQLCDDSTVVSFPVLLGNQYGCVEIEYTIVML